MRQTKSDDASRKTLVRCQRAADGATLAASRWQHFDINQFEKIWVCIIQTQTQVTDVGWFYLTTNKVKQSLFQKPLLLLIINSALVLL